MYQYDQPDDCHLDTAQSTRDTHAGFDGGKR